MSLSGLSLEQVRALAIEEKHDQILAHVEKLENWARPKIPLRIRRLPDRDICDWGGDEPEE